MKKIFVWFIFFMFLVSPLCAQEDTTGPIVPERIVLPIQPPTPKATPIQIEPMEPKPSSDIRWFKVPTVVSPPEIGQETPSPGIYFKSPTGVVPPPSLGGEPTPSGLQFKNPSGITAPAYHNPYNPTGISSMQFKSPSMVSGASSAYSEVILGDFTGGLNLSHLPNQIADNEATEMENFIWTSAGKLTLPPGFTKYNTTEFEAGKRIYGMHVYHPPDDQRLLLVGVNAKLWADSVDTNRFFTVKTGLQSNSKYYDFETFKGKAIVAHEGDYPFWYDGDSTQNLGLIYNGLITEAKDTNECTGTGDIRAEFWVTIPKLANVENDEFVGFTSRVISSNAPTGSIKTFITKFRPGATEDTVFMPSFPAFWETSIDSTDTIQIYANFSIGESVSSGTITGVSFVAPSDPYCGHYYRLYDASKFWSPENYYTGYVFRLKKKENIKYATRYILHIYSDSVTVPCYSGDGPCTYRVGDEYEIRSLNFYTFRLVKVYKNRIFAVAKESDPTLKERVVFSKYNDLNNFSPDDYFTVHTQDGGQITALATFYEDQLGYKDQSKDCLVIFKENSTWKLIWESEDNYYLVQVSDNVGCVAPQSIVNVEGKYLLFLHSTGTYAFNGRTLQLISQKVKPLLDSLNYVRRFAAGAYYDRHYYLSYPDGGWGRCNKTIMFNVDFSAWSKRTGMRGNIYVTKELFGSWDTTKVLFSDWQDKTLIYQMYDAVSTDTGQAIPLTFKSKAFDFRSIADRKGFTYFDIDYSLTSGNFSAYFYTDFGDSLRYNTTVSEYGGYRYVHLPLDVDCSGRNFSFKLTSSSDLELGKVAIKFKKLKE